MNELSILQQINFSLDFKILVFQTKRLHKWAKYCKFLIFI